MLISLLFAMSSCGGPEEEAPQEKPTPQKKKVPQAKIDLTGKTIQQVRDLFVADRISWQEATASQYTETQFCNALWIKQPKHAQANCSTHQETVLYKDFVFPTLSQKDFEAVRRQSPFAPPLQNNEDLEQFVRSAVTDAEVMLKKLGPSEIRNPFEVGRWNMMPKGQKIQIQVYAPGIESVSFAMQRGGTTGGTRSYVDTNGDFTITIHIPFYTIRQGRAFVTATIAHEIVHVYLKISGEKHRFKDHAEEEVYCHEISAQIIEEFIKMDPSNERLREFVLYEELGIKQRQGTLTTDDKRKIQEFGKFFIQPEIDFLNVPE